MPTATYTHSTTASAVFRIAKSIRVPIRSSRKVRSRFEVLCDHRRTRYCSLASSRTERTDRVAIRWMGEDRRSFDRGLDGSEAYHDLARRKGLEGGSNLEGDCVCVGRKSKVVN